MTATINARGKLSGGMGGNIRFRDGDTFTRTYHGTMFTMTAHVARAGDPATFTVAGGRVNKRDAYNTVRAAARAAVASCACGRVNDDGTDPHAWPSLDGNQFYGCRRYVATDTTTDIYETDGTPWDGARA